MSRKRWYVGIRASELGDLRPYGEAFPAESTPTEDSHGNRFACTIGPFVTRRGAEYMAKYGRANPHCRCVAEAERLAKISDAHEIPRIKV